MANEITRKHGRWYVENAGRRVSGPFLTLGQLHRSVPGSTHMKLGLRGKGQFADAAERQPARRIDRRRLGELMSSWGSDSGSGLPVYAVGSYYYGGHVYPDPKLVERAIAEVESYIPKAEHGVHGWTKKDAADLRRMASGLRYYLEHDYPAGGARETGVRRPRHGDAASGETITWDAIAMRALARRLHPWSASGHASHEVASNAQGVHPVRRGALREAAEELQTLLKIVRHDARAGGGGRRKGYTMKDANELDWLIAELRRRSEEPQRTRDPEPKFRIGDLVERIDNPKSHGKVSFIGQYDEVIGGYRYKVLESSGSRIYWNEGSMRRRHGDVRRHHEFKVGDRVELAGCGHAACAGTCASGCRWSRATNFICPDCKCEAPLEPFHGKIVEIDDRSHPRRYRVEEPDGDRRWHNEEILRLR